MANLWKAWPRKRSATASVSSVSATSSASSVASQRGAAAPAAVRGPLSQRAYYHGLVCREDVDAMLQDTGDYIVRVSEIGERSVLVVSVKVAGGTKHVVVERDAGNNMWTVQRDRAFSTPEDLVDYYAFSGDPLDGAAPGAVRLLHGVERQKWELAADQVQLRERLGSGAFGDVHAALLLVDKTRYLQCAVKRVNNPNYVGKEQREALMGEARLMRNYEHGRVVKLYGVVAEAGAPLMLVMELAAGGDLLSHVRKPANAALGAKARVTYAHEAAEGMRYLEKQQCIHRDLAARNCLLDAGGHVKLSDFGLSVQSATGTEVESGAMRCAIKWQAPEVLLAGTFSTKSDVWSFAVLIYEINSNGREPYADYSVADARLHIQIGRLRPTPPPANMDGPGAPPATPPQVAKLMEQMAAADADKRPNFLYIKLKLRKILKKMAE